MDIYYKLSDNYDILLKEIKCPNKGKDRPCSQMGIYHKIISLQIIYSQYNSNHNCQQIFLM